MATITANINIVKTVATLDAASITSILAWIQTNVKDKLPTDATVNISFSINP